MTSLVLAVVLAQGGGATGKPVVARLSLSALPDDLSTRQAFDDASRVQLIALAFVLQRAEGTSEGQRRWLRFERERVVKAFAEANGSELSLEDLAAKQLPEASLVGFWEAWVGEQLRLAQLFPKPTSEIFPLEADDVLGDELPSRTFVLTFDDGPSPRGGTTEATVGALRAARWPGLFFVNGEHLEGRKNLRELYGKACVASHGERHQPHTTALAPASVQQVQKRLAASGIEQARVDLFRPPYGQRGDAVRQFLRAEKVRTVLWNIDSQDWRTDMTVDDAAGRVLALMLAKRRGVILFHDVHPIAPGVIPLLKHRLGDVASIVDCSSWPK